MYIKHFSVFGLILISLLVLTGCTENKADTYSRDIFAMDTYINCKVVANDPETAEKGLDQIEKAFIEIDSLTNRFDSNSELSAVNQNAGIAPVKVDQDVYQIVETALTWSDKTGGAFNILIGSAMDLWGFGSDHPRVPAQAELAEPLSKMDYHQIILDPQNSTLFLPRKGMVMDLGGVAKGYATDKAVAALKKTGIKNALINAGGNVYVLGSGADGSAWNVGVQDPRNPQGIVDVISPDNSALVSSGDYERYFIADGIRYHHILDPATGCPARASSGTTVIMKSAAVADILSTALFVKGPTDGIKLAESFDQVDAVMIIAADGRKYNTRTWNKYRVDE